MISVKDINQTIIRGDFTNDQLDSIVIAVKFARNTIAKRNKSSLWVGDTVKFTSSRRGELIMGTVQKINRKFIVVRENGNRNLTWRVPANMLEAV
jgi:ribosomal protein L35AE/L33A